MGDFNCSEVKWENYECSGEDNSWGNRLLKLTMENVMKQWVTENTRYRGENEPTRQVLIELFKLYRFVAMDVFTLVDLLPSKLNSDVISLAS